MNQLDSERASSRLETIATVLMAIATIATAWCAYQSTVFGGDDDEFMHEADVVSRQINGLRTSAMQRISVDVHLFSEWVDATATQHADLATFYYERFTPQLRTAFDQWIATKPATSSIAPSHPFRMTSYKVPENLKADSLQSIYEQHLDRAAIAGDHSERYILLTVVFASVLFFGGITSNIEAIRLKTVLVGCSSALLLVALVWMGTLPMILR